MVFCFEFRWENNREKASSLCCSLRFKGKIESLFAPLCFARKKKPIENFFALLEGKKMRKLLRLLEGEKEVKKSPPSFLYSTVTCVFPSGLSQGTVPFLRTSVSLKPSCVARTWVRGMSSGVSSVA